VNYRITFKETVGHNLHCFEDEEWLEKLACLANTLHHMKQPDKSMQGPGECVLTSSQNSCI
jgi:hypothetical protein